MSPSAPEISVRKTRRTDLFKSGFVVDWPFIGLTAVADGKIVGYAGVQRFGVHHWVFFNAFDDAVKRPFWLHRLVKDVLKACDAAGIGPLYSLVEAGGERWNGVLGFRPITEEMRDDEIAFCERSNNQRAWIR
jgi:hypothetical protein